MNQIRKPMKELKAEKSNSEFFQKLSNISKKRASDVLSILETSLNGLNTQAVEERIEKFGLNEITHEKERGWLWRLLLAAKNPLVILLLVLATIAFLTEDIRSGIVMTLMVILGITLRFIQETKADNAAAKLKAMINVTATVIREGIQEEVALKNLVPGDIIVLSAGDMIPADVRILSAKDLFLIQASLTGESLPVEKYDICESRENINPIELCNIAFLGTSIESGSATAVVVTTGSQTYFGTMSKSIEGEKTQTSFEKGVNRFTWLMIRFMVIMVPLVFIINGLTKHNWVEAFFFALSVAVGLTPEMLPMIVSVSLSKGAILMSKKKVIVKRLNAIQNFGAMNILCADKTGTLTIDKVILEHHCDVVNEEDDSVLLDAYLISHFQTGLKNVLDRAILHQSQVIRGISIGQFQKVDEIPFDFSRRMMSVVVKEPEGSCRLLTKGAPEEIFKRCTKFELHNEILPMDPILIQDLKEEYEELSSDGFRVLALAYRDMEHKTTYTKNDENDLVLKGYVAFLDPPKDTAAPAILALQKHGIEVKILTGDNDLVTKKICFEVGLPTDRILLGEQVERMDDKELAQTASEVAVFARLSPSHKERIIRVLREKGNVVGFMGDGINDAPALKAADVGISVDTAVDIAKESADVILLEKSLMVLEEGVLEGRKVFVNILKYVRMGASSNFGNMFSVLGASAFLPFIPMAPIQVLTNNLLYDFSQVPIPTDEVDPEQITKPRPWNIDEIKRFILFIGPISSIFDYTTYFIMLYVFNCWDPSKASLFQTGWFVESLMTQTLIIHVIRTNKIPFIQSRPSWPLIVTTVLVMTAGMLLPFSPLAKPLGFEQLPPLYWPLLALTLLCYIILTQGVKTFLLRKKWI
jgi:Mg2+-importing ATPase